MPQTSFWMFPKRKRCALILGRIKDDPNQFLNVSKTKEMCINFRKNQRCSRPVCIKGKAVEKVDTYQYLGVVFDSKLNWKENINSVIKKKKKKKKNELENVLHEKAEIIWSQFRCASNFL